MVLFRFETVYVGHNSIPHKYLDKTQGIPLMCVNVSYFIKNIRLKIQSIVKSVLPRQSITGVYVMRNGKSVKIGSKAGGFDIWQLKHKMFPDQGDREYHNFMYNQDRKGKLFDVDDRICWQESLKKYGRGRVDVGY